MRLWSIHPKYLDAKGLTACWRESLLAQDVLSNKTKGYKNHAQLIRFKNTKDPIYSICCFLYTIYEEAKRRNYKYDYTKIKHQRIVRSNAIIPVTNAQLKYEFEHLKNKLAVRSPQVLLKIKDITNPEENPIFKPIVGDIETWEAVRNYD